MAQVNPYLIFNGDCEAAFNLYKSVFGGEFPYMGRFGEMPPAEGQPELPENEKNLIMHVSLPIGNTIIMGSDSNSQAGNVKMGENVSISINTESRAEADKIFNGLSDGGMVKMPMTDTFWGAYFGMFVDKFGIHWMINFDEIPNQ
jgi:PhnB protein